MSLAVIAGDQYYATVCWFCWLLIQCNCVLVLLVTDTMQLCVGFPGDRYNETVCYFCC